MLTAMDPVMPVFTLPGKSAGMRGISQISEAEMKGVFRVRRSWISRTVLSMSIFLRTITDCPPPFPPARPGDPHASAAAILKIVDAEKPPLRCFFGELPIKLAKADYESRLKTWEEWQPVAELAQG